MQSARRSSARIAAVVIACMAVLLPPALPAVADTVRDKEYWLEDYGITDAWATTQGEGVTVAVIDSGIDGSHPDLAGAVIGGTDVSGAGAPDGQLGLGEVPPHGTLVGTLLAGRGHTADRAAATPSAGATTSPADEVGEGPHGVIGVAPKAQLLAVSVWIEGATSGPNPAGVSVDEQIPAAVRWAVDHGADVINMSLGSNSTAWPESWDDAFLYAERNDVVIVAAAGNRAGGLTQVGAPATIPGVLAVAGLDRSGVASAGASSEGISIAVAAPSEYLVGGLPGGSYADWSGTSGAAPIVSGVAALIRSKYPELSAAEVVNRIVDTARDAGPPGFDTLYGHGVLNVAAAVSEGVQVPTASRLGSMAEWIQLHRRSGPSPAPAPPTPSAPPPEALAVPPAPVAEDPLRPGDTTAMIVVLGSAGLLLVVVVGGTLHVVHVLRRSRTRNE